MCVFTQKNTANKQLRSSQTTGIRQRRQKIDICTTGEKKIASGKIFVIEEKTLAWKFIQDSGKEKVNVGKGL